MCQRTIEPMPIMPSPPTKTEEGTTAWQIKSADGGILIILMIVAMVVGFLIFSQTYVVTMLNWPTTEGVVVVHYQHDFKYRYAVGEQKYTKLHYGYLDNFAYRDGDKIKVRYNPDEPMNSHPDLGFSLDVMALSLIEVLDFLGIAYMFKTRFKRVKLKEPEYMAEYDYTIEMKD